MLNKTVFTLKVMLFKKSPNSFADIWATFVLKIVAKIFKNRPIWSHCWCRPIAKQQLPTYFDEIKALELTHTNLSTQP